MIKIRNISARSEAKPCQDAQRQCRDTARRLHEITVLIVVPLMVDTEAVTVLPSPLVAGAVTAPVAGQAKEAEEASHVRVGLVQYRPFRTPLLK